MRSSKLLITLFACGLASWAALATDTVRPDEPHPVSPDPHVKSVIVASPRVALVTEEVPITPQPTNFVVVDPPVRLRSLGDAYNFTKENQTIRVRQGTIVDVLLSRNAEGVWYDMADGWLGAHLCAYVKYFSMSPTDALDSVHDWIPWRFVGCDGASALRRGPLIGRVRNPIHVPVPVYYQGTYLIKALVISFAFPIDLSRNPGGDHPSMAALHSNDSGKVAVDEVFIRVDVPAWHVPPIDPLPHFEFDLIEELPRETLPGVHE